MPSADTVVGRPKSRLLIPQYGQDMPAGYFYASNRVTMPEHGGTHIDAPVHLREAAIH